jgi:hypothetical protein
VASGRLTAKTVPTAALGPDAVEGMWRLFERYYADVSRERFEQDLAPKDHVILLRDSGDGSLRGFSTLQTYRRELDGRPVVAVFSGDTVVDASYWGQRALHRAFVAHILRRKLEHPLTPVYWFLITKGYKTYLLLQRNFPVHWPRHDRKTPEWEQRVLDRLATDRFGDAYRPELGVLRFDEACGRLRPEVAPIDEESLRDPAIRFFHERNPGAAEGDELVCLGLVDVAMCLHFLSRQVKRLGARRAA